MEFIFINLALLLILIFLLVILSWVWPPHSPWAPWWRTNRKTARAICDLAKITRSDLVYDLGCGDGSLIITASKEYNASAVGIEIEPTRFLISTIRVFLNRLSSKATVKRENFFDTDLSKATVVVVYLIPKTFNLLLPKFKKELKKGTRIVSYRYEIGLPAIKKDKKNKLLLYSI